MFKIFVCDIIELKGTNNEIVCISGNI
jgi:hypothetical protein